MLRREALGVQTRFFYQQGVKLRFNRAHANVLAVARLVRIVEMGAAIQAVCSAFRRESVGCRHGKKHRHQRCRAIDHGRINHLPFARALRLQETTDDAVGQQHAAAAKIAHQVERRHRFFTGPANRMQGAHETDVVDIVTGSLR